jgi:hypothetical protein
MSLISQMPLVPGRDCGTCYVCCIALTVNDGGLFKPQGTRCPNLTGAGLCGIYEDRPSDCAAFYCGYRRLKWVKDTLRPDQSGVLVVIGYINPAVWEVGVSITLLTEQALDAPGLVETVTAAVKMEMPLDLIVPGPPGHTSGWARMNDSLAQPVQNNDMEAVRQILRDTRDTLAVDEHRPITPDGSA